jgi:hypothetical protein
MSVENSQNTNQHDRDKQFEKTKLNKEKEAAARRASMDIDPILDRLRNNTLAIEDMKTLAKYPKILEAQGYGYLHAFAEDQCQLTSPRQGKNGKEIKDTSAQIQHYLEKNGKSEEFLELIEKGLYKSVYDKMPDSHDIKARHATSMTMSLISNQAGKENLDSGYSRATKEICEVALKKDRDVSEQEIAEFVTTYPMIVPLIAETQSHGTPGLQQVIAVGRIEVLDAEGKSTTIAENYKNIARIRQETLRCAFSTDPKDIATLGQLNAEMDKIYKNSKDMGLLPNIETTKEFVPLNKEKVAGQIPSLMEEAKERIAANEQKLLITSSPTTALPQDVANQAIIAAETILGPSSTRTRTSRFDPAMKRRPSDTSPTLTPPS